MCGFYPLPPHYWLINCQLYRHLKTQHVPALIYSNDRNPQEWHYTAPDGKTGVLRVVSKMSANNGDVLRELAIAGRGRSLPQFLH